VLKALVFDIDGTLYRQRPLRRAMLSRLVAAHLAHPLRGLQTLRVLREYRHAQEVLRDVPVSGDLAAAQIDVACQRTRVDREVVLRCVARWMEQEPLQFLARCLQPGVVDFLQDCRKRGLRLAALSDYPADAKLQALGLSDLFDLVLCAQSPEVNVFKPNPRGLLLALERLGAAPGEGLYIGDRKDVDAPTARTAGVPCAIITRAAGVTPGGTYFEVSSYRQLHDALWAGPPLPAPLLPT
jgi:HAD superfamily hydrolase (TIGR01549 family)